MDVLKKSYDILKYFNSISLRFRPKNNDVFEKGKMITKTFEELSVNQRIHIFNSISPSLAMKLLALSGFMAEAAINTKDKTLIRASVLLHAIEDFRIDYRENYRYLVLIAYASNELGVDLNSIVESIEKILSERAKKALGDFLSRDEQLNCLASFGVRADFFNGEFRFVSD